MTTNDPCLHSTVKQGSDVCHFRSSQLGPRIRTRLSLYFLCLCLALWLCVKISSENRVLVVLLQIGAKDLTVTCKLRPHEWINTLIIRQASGCLQWGKGQPVSPGSVFTAHRAGGPISDYYGINQSHCQKANNQSFWGI